MNVRVKKSRTEPRSRECSAPSVNKLLRRRMSGSVARRAAGVLGLAGGVLVQPGPVRIYRAGWQPRTIQAAAVSFQTTSNSTAAAHSQFTACSSARPVVPVARL
jgi:hypothetical protein